jgi:peptidylprolyl isomerase
MEKIIIGLVVAAIALFGGYWVLSTSSVNLAAAPAATTTSASPSAAADGFSATLGANDTAPPQVPPAEAAPQPTTQSNKKYMRAILHTNKGDITIEFADAQAPNTVANFVKLASSGFYDGTKFHRVIKGFMIQGGDPLSKDDSMMARWGTGGPGYQFADEIGPDNHDVAGTIAMANAGPNTNGSQFFINVADNNFLDTKHTVFGKVVAGMEVVTAIENTPTDANDRPVEAMIINSVTLR